MRQITLMTLVLVLSACNKASDPDFDAATSAQNSDAGTNSQTSDSGENSAVTDMGGPGLDVNTMAGDMPSGQDMAPVDLGPPPDPLDGIGMSELVQGNFQFTEGPRWFPAQNVLRFTDVQANTIYELAEPNAITPFNSNSQGSNGLAFDGTGNVLACEHSGRRIAIYAGTTPSTLVGDYMGGRFNSPNDIVVRSDGTLYFTDPPYGLTGQREIQFNGLFRYVPSSDTLVAEWEGSMASRPNGVVLSPDESLLYLADTAGGEVRAFDVATDGTLSGERGFVSVGGPDGMAIDTWGNLYVAASSGIAVFAPDGASWGTISVGEQPANCAFGGADAKTLYVTARTGLYRVQMVVEGIY